MEPEHDAPGYQRLTPYGAGGIHVFRIWGRGAGDLIARHCRFKSQSGGELRLATLADGGDAIDEVLVSGPDAASAGAFEVSAHGSVAVDRRISELLEAAGFRRRDSFAAAWERGDPAARAPRLAAEAWVGLTRAWAPEAVLFFAAALDGALAVEGARLARFASWARSPGDAAAELARESIETLLRRAALGLAFGSPPVVVLAGAVNVGKSSLFNRLTDSERVLVSDQAGTTRDAIEARWSIRGYPFVLVDTAGERETGDELERAGIERARARRLSAQIVLHVTDAPAREPAASRRGGVAVDVVNKIDRAGAVHANPASLEVFVSAHSGEGVELLRGRILRRSAFALPATRELPCPFTERHVNLLRAAHAALATDPRAAAAHLDELAS
jgi:tRNA modification GTPase